ncbi:hypothetical protein CLOM_g9966 [Closterium sp. NIES-68]|nr:hypothetical protein CLOM_g7001 [Closterium sp. NIES-68]GJP50803.1 hypothetical protein CLOM_g9966 [Closterium sp. NIES-68]GJP68434.1 hypothetical protein CLOP_g25144 [Closterium sp. NIES-67]GJP86420.1 hypothetical protein CLOP_g16447 [Closterium sp. NIES-67]
MSSSRAAQHACRAAFSHVSRQLPRLSRPFPSRPAIVAPPAAAFSSHVASPSAHPSAHPPAHPSAHPSAHSPARSSARSAQFSPVSLAVSPLITARLVTPSAHGSSTNLSRLIHGATISRSLKPSLTSSTTTLGISDPLLFSSRLSQHPTPSLTAFAAVSAVSGCRFFGSKIKVKPYSSLKRRFKLLANGEYKRWRSGKRHNASTKTKKQRRQLRRPSVVPPGLKQPMRYLGFRR